MIRGELENMPFKASDQKSTLTANSRMFARLLCSVIRTIEQSHRWFQQYSFDDKQLKGADELREAVDAEEVDEAAVKEAIHQLELTLFCKKRKEILKGDFACSIYRFLVISSIKKGGSFMMKSNI